MVDATIFYKRKNICQLCPNWKGVCLKGHALASPVGCPEKRFEPVEGAAYMPDNKPAQVPPRASRPCCGGKVQEDLKELSYAEAARSLAQSLQTWAMSGFPLASDSEYDARLSVCRGCSYYRWYQCRLCKCIILVKAKLRSSICPGNYWPKIS